MIPFQQLPKQLVVVIGSPTRVSGGFVVWLDGRLVCIDVLLMVAAEFSLLWSASYPFSDAGFASDDLAEDLADDLADGLVDGLTVGWLTTGTGSIFFLLSSLFHY